MNTVKFKESHVTYAEDQSEYIDLPAHKHGGKEGRITCCWHLSFWERLRVLFLGYIWHDIYTFNMSLQPQHLSTVKPDMINYNILEINHE